MKTWRFLGVATLMVHSLTSQAAQLDDWITDDVQGVEYLEVGGFQEHNIDSGTHDGQGEDFILAFSEVVQANDAHWIRIHFGDCNLGRESFVRITSVFDGNTQELSSRIMNRREKMSAYFNGDALEIELHVAPGDTRVRLQVDAIEGGQWETCENCSPSSEGLRTLCGPDNRVASTDSRVGRIVLVSAFGTMSAICTGWLISNGAVLTAGHCVDSDPDGLGPLLPDGVVETGFLNGFLEFDVPASLSDGRPQFGDVEDRFPISSVFVHRYDGVGQGLGKDFAVFSIESNPDTGEVAHVGRGFFRVTREAPAASATIRITGFGGDKTPSGSAGLWNSQSQTNQTSTGPYVGESTSNSDVWHTYRADSMGGNSGGPIIWNDLGVTIGIHTTGGCNADGGANSGTSFGNVVMALAMSIFIPQSVYVDAGMPSLAPENGNLFHPFDTMPEAIAASTDGGTISIVEGSYPASDGNVFTLGADGMAITLIAPVGAVTIGN